MINNSTPREMLFKVMIVGQQRVGKSSILKQYVSNIFDESLLKTIGVDFNVKVINNQGVLCKMQIWDTAGQERFRNIVHTYFRGSHGMVLVFDLTSKQTFNLLNRRILEIKNFASQTIPIILVGNKCQSHKEIKISRQQINIFCSENNLTYVQASAKSKVNITYVFQQLTRQMIFHRNGLQQQNNFTLKEYQEYKEQKLQNKQIKYNNILIQLPLVIFILLIVFSFNLSI